VNGLSALLRGLPGARVCGDLDTAAERVVRVHSDTRTLLPGDLFVALSGERFDANTLLGQARALGAVLAVANRGLLEAGLPGVEVPDTRVALGRLAQGWRGLHALPLIAVTGSNGKTTVTQMLASILQAAAGEAALATRGNFNNDIGVPLTLLRLRSAHRLAVVELGMNHPGEIAGLAAMAQPTVALVNNAQREHQEFMATVEAVARENASVFAALPTDGVAVFPAGDVYTGLWHGLAAGRSVVTFHEDPAVGADVFASFVWEGDAWALQVQTPGGAFQACVAVAGRHNVRNALAATACAWAAGVGLDAIAQGLSSFAPVQGRSRATQLVLPTGHRLTLVDDSYNANPDSVRAAIDVVAGLPGPGLLALGDMGEVGEQGLAFHQEVLRYAQSVGVAHVVVTGDWMAQACASLAPVDGVHLRHHPRYDDLEADVLAALGGVSSVLVKGSRFMRMERLVKTVEGLAAKGVNDVA
jgi:UDP-N-acetylmuramoyl-tripeptide--D-alanyl-D-alanine ligase